jgi:hypothetical protein
MISAIKEWWQLRREVQGLVAACLAEKTANPALAGRSLYRAVLLRSSKVPAEDVDSILRRAESSLDEWTSPEGREMGLREVIHYLTVSQHIDSGRAGTLVAVDKLVRSLVPDDL